MKKALLFPILIFFINNIFGQTSAEMESVALIVNLPLLDFPYQSYSQKTTGGFLKGYGNPSMSQSLEMSNNLYSAVHWGIKKIIKTENKFKKIMYSNSLAAAFDFFTLYTPLGSGWLHEEYHRAVMTRREINSFNDMNTFPFGSEIISVRKVKDDDLVRLKDKYQSDFSRLMVAGNEAQYHQLQSLQKNNFYYNQDLPHLALYWMNTFTNIIYVNLASSDDFDKIVDEVNARDGDDISKRDFTGPDFTAWVDALFNPDKPYKDRGVHPSGIGINRYIKPSSLSVEERNYLQKQGKLQWLNLLSPHLFGFAKIKIKESDNGNYYGNFAVRHLLTSFGNDISIEVLYQSPAHKFFFSLHNYSNRISNFSGIEGALIDLPVLNHKMVITARSILWMQPENQAFTASKGSFGGLIGIKGKWQFENFYPYVEIEGKTNGWVMGNVYLDENIRFNIGCYVVINK